ncbi:uncharacterized protein LOC128708269 [Anopheles marshallii]|uniref:uncharacterized protein LOC128708269 n=1 Tax=Anopheles marshallii TaxID=1521116 RepID=UPI00237BDC92|nr:uncharacterized protein LOC128708269 [Anopheles marshallii]
MNRLDESESTPKKRNMKPDETVVKEATTKSGRKVKRPAHLDSLERTPSASPSDARKSVAVRAKNAVEPFAGTPSKRAATKEQDSPEEVKGSRKTIATVRKTISGDLNTPKKNKEKKQVANTVDDAAGISKSGRKIKIPTKLMEFEGVVLSSPRKLAVPGQDEAVKGKAAKTPGRTKTPAKSAVKNIGVEQNLHPYDDGEKNLAVRKTPGRRAKSVAPDQLDVENVRTPKRKGVLSSSLLIKEEEKESAASEQTHPKTPGKRVGKPLLDLDAKASPKTPGRRGKSVAPIKGVADATDPAHQVSQPESKVYKDATKTLGRRVGKSIINPTVHTSHSESSDSIEAVPKTPGRRATKSMIDASITASVESPRAQRSSAKTPGRRQKSVAVDKIDPVQENRMVGKVDKITTAEEPLSRSGRKLKKPKKVLDYEQEEKSTEPNDTNEQVSTDSRRERNADNNDEAIKSPTKRKIIDNLGPQTPKLKSHIERDHSVLGTESPHMENSTDVSVSRSGRKIKPKRMFGFDDAVETTTTTFVHVTGSSSPTLIEETVEDDIKNGNLTTMNVEQPDTRSVSIDTASTPSKRTAASAANVDRNTSVPMAIDKKMEGVVDAGEMSKQRSYITNRGVDDHHPITAKVVEQQQHLIDETDRAMVSPQPVIIRTSIGFGKPTVLKQPLLEESTVSEGDDCSKVNKSITQPSIDAQTVGSSRSGRKIKPKKFFDTDDLTTASRQSVVNPQANQPVPVSAMWFPTQQVVEQEKNEEFPTTASVSGDEVMNSADEIDIPEGPVKLVNKMIAENLNDEGKEQKQQHITSIESEQVTSAETDHNGVVMKPEEDAQNMEVQEEKIEISDERTIATKEESAAQLVEEQSIVPKNQHVTLEEGKVNQSSAETHISNVIYSDGSGVVVQSNGEDAPLKDSSLNAEVNQNPLGEHSSVKDTDLAAPSADHDEGGNVITDETVNETSDAIVTSQDVFSASIVDTKSGEKRPYEVPTGSIISPSGTADEEMLDEASLGSIEYLEDEMNNIVEHIKKPVTIQERAEEGSSHSASVMPSVVIISATPARSALNETYSPVKLNSSIIDITADTPRPEATAAAPRTPDLKLTAQEANNKYSPDKPPEVIEIMDSPAVAAFCKQINDDSAHAGDGGSATSTPFAIKPSLVQTVTESVDNKLLNVQLESRKRSLSASAADTTMKRNVTFHSPANSTMLVETIDERLMLKSLQDQQQQRQETMETSSKSIGEKLRKPRKRSLSEHKPSELKRSKTSKLPNFKSIHANHFNRMESLADFMKRKESRAKQILSSCSPATKLLPRPITDASGQAGVPSVEKKIPSSTAKPFIFKSAGGGIPVPSAGLFVVRAKKGPNAAKKPIVSDTERMANRMKQFQTTFKPKQIGTDTSAVPVSGSLPSTSTHHGAGDRPVDQLRSKQSKILKGVRTNRRFDLQMKHRDNLQHQ